MSLAIRKSAARYRGLDPIPVDGIIYRHLLEGMTHTEIAARYRCDARALEIRIRDNTRDWERRPPVFLQPDPDRKTIVPIETLRGTVRRLAEHSLPRVTMHVRAIEERPA